MQNKVFIFKEGDVWVVRIITPAGTQVYRCSTEIQARHMGVVFGYKPMPHDEAHAHL